jgi:hypothetical protein
MACRWQAFAAIYDLDPVITLGKAIDPGIHGNKQTNYLPRPK